MLVVILVLGNLYFQLHALPERMAHKTNIVQMEVVAVLVLISLFTHNHFFWIAGLLLALIRIPDFSTPLETIAGSLAQIARQRDEGHESYTPAKVPLSRAIARAPTESADPSTLDRNSEALETVPASVEQLKTDALREGG